MDDDYQTKVSAALGKMIRTSTQKNWRDAIVELAHLLNKDPDDVFAANDELDQMQFAEQINEWAREFLRTTRSKRRRTTRKIKSIVRSVQLLRYEYECRTRPACTLRCIDDRLIVARRLKAVRRTQRGRIKLRERVHANASSIQRNPQRWGLETRHSLKFKRRYS